MVSSKTQWQRWLLGDFSRRDLGWGALAMAVWFRAQGLSAAEIATPQTGRGPFYPVGGAQIVIWQTDANGVYDHPEASRLMNIGGQSDLEPAFRYWGKTETDSDGSYQFRTIEPGGYRLRGRRLPRPRHVHFEVSHPEMHFAGDPHAADDFVTTWKQHLLLAVSPEPDPLHSGELLAEFNLVVRDLVS